MARKRRYTEPVYTHDGKTQTLARWAREYGMGYGTLWCRLRAGWTFQEALTYPVRGRAAGKRGGHGVRRVGPA